MLLLLAMTGCSESFVGPVDQKPSLGDTGAPDSADADTDTDAADTDDTDSADTDTDPGDTDPGDTSTDPGDTDPPDTGPYDTGPYDADRDGSWDADDCDDDDRRVYPGAEEIWYDGIDQDCDGNDTDQDLDGYASPAVGGDDCDDTDAAVNPAAAEVWYDGADQDCDGNDTDQDGDGFVAEASGGADCDDTNAASHPGATEVWYDGVDEGCDGGEDYDQDGDGTLAPSGGGEDCDDTDAAVNPSGAETLDDGVDGDCDGDADRPRFQTLDTFGSTDTQGPRIGEMTGYVLVTWLADGMRYSGTPLTTAAGMQLLATSDLRSGPASDTWWEWGSGYSFDSGVDFWADDDHWMWAYGLHYGGTRYLLGDGYALATSAWGNTGVSRSTSQTFDDVELIEDTDGRLHVVGCDSGGGYLTWVHGSRAELANGLAFGYERANVLSDTCGALPSSSWLLASFRSAGTLGTYTYSDSAGLSYSGVLTGWNAYDIETLLQDGEIVIAAAEGSDGVYTYKYPDAEVLPAADASQVDVAMDSRGRLYVVYIDGARVWLYWGEPASGYTSVELDTGLVDADDLDVHVTVDDEVVVAVRDGDDITYGVITAY
jgi:hypothetical protein